jgi:hypothetical protein
MTFYTPAGRLLGSGWDPGEAIARVVLQREVLWSALAEVSAIPHRPQDLPEAVRLADRDGIVAAITAAALVTWADLNLQRGFEVPAVEWNLELKNALSELIAKDPEAVLQSLEGVRDQEAAAPIREEAQGYLAHALVVSDPKGRPVFGRALRHHSEFIPRLIRPLAPLPEPAVEVEVEAAG